MLPLVYFFAGFTLDTTPDDGTYSVCMLAIGCLTCTMALEIHAEPNALLLGTFFIVLITLWSQIQPAVLNHRMLAVWLLFLPRLRDVCVMTPVDGQWVATTISGGLFHR